MGRHKLSIRRAIAPVLAILIAFVFIVSSIAMVASADSPITSSDLIESNISQGNITLFSQNYSESNSIPSNVFVSKTTYPEIWNASLSYDHDKKALDFSVKNGEVGSLYIAGLTPMEKTTYHMEIGLECDDWNSQSYLHFPGGSLIYQVYDDGSRIIKSLTGDIAMNLGHAEDNRVAIDIILDTKSDTFRVKNNESSFIDIPWSAARQSIPYETVTGGFLHFELYQSSFDASLSTLIYNITQTAPRSYVTALGANKLTAFGLDHGDPVSDVQNGVAAVTEVGGNGTVWLDVGYNFMTNDTELAFYRGLVDDHGWEVGIHFSAKLTDMTMTDATALMRSEYDQLSNRLGEAPKTWCCLTGANNITHVTWAYVNLGLLCRDFDMGTGMLSNVGNLWTDTMPWWTEGVSAGIIMPTFTHGTDVNPPGPYSLNLTDFKKWVDGYTASGIEITSFLDWYMTNLNAGDGQATNILANEQAATFTMSTNGARCYVNVNYLATATTVVSDQATGSINYQVELDGSISFWTENGHTYIIGPAEVDYIFTVSDGMATITGYSGAGGAITIPSILGGYLVVAIGDYAFHSCTSLTAVTIPDSVTTIGDGAFDHCTNMESITIPDSVTTIGSYAFFCCNALTSVTIPGGVSTIGDYTFHACTSLTSVTISAGVTSIGNGTFDHCTALASVTIPSSVATVGNYAFFCCTSLASATMSTGVTLIGDAAFSQCSSLTDVTIPGTVMSMGDYVFYSCTAMTSATMLSGVTTIGDGAFDHCTQMTSVTIPSGVTTIGNYAFFYCSSLTSVTIPGSVSSIGDYTFYMCSSLSSVTIQSGVAYIHTGAFDHCTALYSITIPGSVTAIQDFAFFYCTALSTVTIESGVNIIGTGAFFYCTALTSATIPGSVTSVGDYAFYYCTALTSANMLSGIANIGSGAFDHCKNMVSVTIPESVTSIGNYAFFCCSSLVSVSIPGSVSTIGDYMFYSCTSLTSVSFSEGATTLGNGAFDHCTALTSVTMPSSINSIGDYLFYSCKALDSFSFLGLVAPSVGTGWITGTSSGILGHAYAASNFPAPGGVWNGLTMGDPLT